MFIAIIVLVGLSLLIFAHEAGHFFAARFFGMRIDEFGFGFPPRIIAKKKGDVEYSLNWLPFGGFVRIAGENDRLTGNLEVLEKLPEEEKKKFFLFQPAWKRSVVILAGVAINFIIGWGLLSLVSLIGSPSGIFIERIQEGSPAEVVGLLRGDVIQTNSGVDEFIEFINVNQGKAIGFSVLRDGEILDFAVTPRVPSKLGEGSLGATLAPIGIEKQPIHLAIVNGFNEAIRISVLTLFSFYDLIVSLFSKLALPEGVVGPVGILQGAQEIGRTGFLYLIKLIAIISLNLATLNLIPFPALDGGRFFLILVEKIKGSPISLKIEAVINGAGFIFLILLMVLVTVRDVANLF